MREGTSTGIDVTEKGGEGLGEPVLNVGRLSQVERLFNLFS